MAALNLNARMIFFAGKGGVGKTTMAAATAIQLARANPSKRYEVISVDPAHALRDVFANERAPENLVVEMVETREKWGRLREKLGAEIERAISAVTPSGLSVAYDVEAMQKLVDIAPPGADELFAISRLADLDDDASLEKIIVDTAPTGHFLRLIDLPRTAGEWVREFMRVLLRYRELIAPGALHEELVKASRALHSLEATLHSDRAAVVAVMRPERIVAAETKRLLSTLGETKIAVAAVIANYVTPENECPCDQSMRAHELEILASLGDVIVVNRREEPVTRSDELANLIAVA